MATPVAFKTCLHVFKQSKIFWAHLTLFLPKSEIRCFSKEVLILFSGKWYLENKTGARGVHITTRVLMLLDLVNEHIMYLF